MEIKAELSGASYRIFNTEINFDTDPPSQITYLYLQHTIDAERQIEDEICYDKTGKITNRTISNHKNNTFRCDIFGENVSTSISKNEFDDSNRLVREVDYDNEGNLVSTSEYAYDENGLLLYKKCVTEKNEFMIEYIHGVNGMPDETFRYYNGKLDYIIRHEKEDDCEIIYHMDGLGNQFRKWIKYFNDSHQLILTGQYDEQNEIIRICEYFYDENEIKVILHDKRRGIKRETYNEYNEKGRIILNTSVMFKNGIKFERIESKYEYF